MEVTSAARWYYVAHLFATMYMPVCLVKYWGKRDVFPIRAWDPAVIVTGGSAAVVGCWMSIASELAPDSDVFITGTPLALVSSIAIDAYIWQLVVLHAKFTATRSQVDIVREQHRRLTSLMTRSSHDKLDLVPSFDVIAFDRRIVSRWAASLFIIANLLVVVIPLVFIRQRSVGAVTALDCHRMRWIMECRGLAYVKITEMGLSLTLFLALLFRLRISQDAIGIKRNLRRIAIIHAVTLLGTVVLTTLPEAYAVVDWRFGLRTTLALLGYHLVFLIGVGVPLYSATAHAYLPERPAATLEAFLADQRNFTAFLQHLQREFSVENLLFWRSAREIQCHCQRLREDDAPNDKSSCMSFSADIDSRPASVHLPFLDVCYEAVRIYRTFIRDGSPCQVNLPFDVSDRLRERFAFVDGMEEYPVDMAIDERCPSVGKCAAKREHAMILAANILADGTIFDAALHEVVELMSKDSLPRFKATTSGQKLWNDFLIGQNELSILMGDLHHMHVLEIPTQL
ncbi:RGS domain-containing protein [Plasmodiophora brassicae]